MNQDDQLLAINVLKHIAKKKKLKIKQRARNIAYYQEMQKLFEVENEINNL